MPNLAQRYATQNYVALEADGERFRFTGFPEDAADPGGAYSEAMLKSVARVEEVLERRESLARDSRFSPTGRQEKLASFARKKAATELENPAEGSVDDNLSRIDSYVSRLRQGIERKRQKLDAYETPEAEDARTAQKDAEFRKYLREEHEDTERRRFLLQAFEEGDEDVIRAVLDHRPELSGIDPNLQDQLREKAIRERHPETIDEIEAEMKALDALETMKAKARDAIHAIASEPVPDASDEAA